MPEILWAELLAGKDREIQALREALKQNDGESNAREEAVGRLNREAQSLREMIQVKNCRIASLEERCADCRAVLELVIRTLQGLLR